jgi:hypothetical protein
VELIDPLDEFERLRCALVTRTAKEPANAVQTPRQAIYALIVRQFEDPRSRLACGLQIISEEVPADQVHTCQRFVAV